MQFFPCQIPQEIFYSIFFLYVDLLYRDFHQLLLHNFRALLLSCTGSCHLSSDTRDWRHMGCVRCNGFVDMAMYGTHVVSLSWWCCCAVQWRTIRSQYSHIGRGLSHLQTSPL